MAVIGALAGISLINSRELRQRAYDAASRSDYRNLQTVTISEQGQSPDVDLNYFIFGVTGPATLPAPLQQGRISKDVQLFYALKFVFSQFSVLAFATAHIKGPYIYSYIDINGTVIEQVIQR